MKVACNIVMSIFIAKVITDSWGIFRLVWLTKLMVFNLRKGKITRWEIGLNVESAVWNFICWICAFVQLFWTGLFLDLDLWTRLWFYIYFVFSLHLWSQSLLRLEAIWSISNSNQWFVSVWFRRFDRRNVYFLPYIYFIYYVYLFFCFTLYFLLSIDVINLIVCCWCYCCLFF